MDHTVFTSREERQKTFLSLFLSRSDITDPSGPPKKETLYSSPNFHKQDPPPLLL